MKLRLPSSLVHALLTTCAAALTTNAPVFADMPEGYTPVVITNVDQLANYTESDYIAFIISSDITDSAYRMTGAHQYWTDDALHTHVLTFAELESDTSGAVLYIDKELAVHKFEQLSFAHHSNAGIYGGAICGTESSVITFNDNGSVMFNENSAVCNNYDAFGGAIYASAITLIGNETVAFGGNSAVSDSGGANGGAIGASSIISLTNNGSVMFNENSAVCNNYDTYGGGAIYGSSNGTITLSDNESVTFSENFTSNFGGAIYADYLTMSANESVEFTGNHARDGGAICGGSSTISLTNNGSVAFTNNTAPGDGGAILGFYGTISLTNNGSVAFTGNHAGNGGAIFGFYGTISLTNNGSVAFTGNDAYDGGAMAIYAVYYDVYDDVSMENNNAVTFSGNTASHFGGAVYTRDSWDSINLENNGSVTFSGNSAAEGGAIYALGPINLENNGSVTFSGNHADCYHYYSSDTDYSNFIGGAIRGYDGIINVAGNESTTFRGNYEQHIFIFSNTATYRLRSVCMELECELTLAAGEGQNITFYDTLYAGTGSKVSFNASYQDKEGVTRNATGDIVFSGKYAEEDLKALNANYTQQELIDSQTTEVYATTHLYGGRMRIEDGAIYKGNGINVAAGSAATLRLADGTLDQAGHDVLLKAGSTLDLAGTNSITADTLDMQDGSTLSFNLGSEEGAILNLNALLQTGELTITISGVLTEEHSLVSLYNASQYDTSLWTSDNVTVVGTTFDHLLWDDGVLTYTPRTPQHIVLNNDTEMEDFGDDKRVYIEGNKHSLTVKHPVDLVQLAMENGVIRLEGEDNNVVRITLTEEGTLQLAAGAGLKVGNIVSMVANGSADLVISGDIEISDIKAYGKPGNKGTLSYANMTTAGDYTIENMTISGSLIDVGEGTTLYLVNVDIKADTHITDAPAHVFAQGTHAQLDETNTWVDKEITTAKDTTLYLCGDTSKSITLAAGTDIVALTSDMFDTVTLTGTDLWLDMTSIAEATYNKKYFSLDFENLAHSLVNAMVDLENLHVYATLDGERYTEAYSTANGGLTTTLYFQVPEPATGTLSLLALAALAARRRRK